MVFGVQLATVLAQVIPIFIFMLLFDRLDLGPSRRGFELARIRSDNHVRTATTLLCMIVFCVSLYVVGTETPATGVLGAAIIVAVIALASLLAIVVVIAVLQRGAANVAGFKNEPGQGDARDHS